MLASTPASSGGGSNNEDVFASARARMAALSAQSPQLARVREDSGVYLSPGGALLTAETPQQPPRGDLFSPGTLMKNDGAAYLSPSHGGNGAGGPMKRPVSIYSTSRCKAYLPAFTVFCISCALCTIGILIVLPSFPHLRDFLHVNDASPHGSLIASVIFLATGVALPLFSLLVCIKCSEPSTKQRQRDAFVADALLEELLSPASITEHYSSYGSKEAAGSKGTIVLLAGASAPRMVMAAFAENLAAAGHKVVVPELPGAGSLAHVPFSLARADRVISRILEREFGLPPSSLLMRASATTAQAIGAASAGAGSLNGPATLAGASTGPNGVGGANSQFVTIPLNGRLVTMNARQAAALLINNAGSSNGHISNSANAAAAAAAAAAATAASKDVLLYGTAVTPPSTNQSLGAVRATAAMAIGRTGIANSNSNSNSNPQAHALSPFLSPDSATGSSSSSASPSPFHRITVASSIASIPEERSLGNIPTWPASAQLSSFHSGFDASASAALASSPGDSLPRYRGSLGIQLQAPSSSSSMAAGAGAGNVLHAALTGDMMSATAAALDETSPLPAEIAASLAQSEAKAADVSQAVTLVSWGASSYVAVHFALRHPEIVVGNVIAGPVPDFSLSIFKRVLRAFCCSCCCSGRCCCIGSAPPPNLSPSWIPFVAASRLKWVAALSNLGLKGRVTTHPRCPAEIKKDILRYDFHLGILPDLRDEVMQKRVFISQLRLRASLPVLLLSGRRYAAAIRSLIPVPAAALQRSTHWRVFPSADSTNPASAALLSGAGGDEGHGAAGDRTGPFALIDSTPHEAYAAGPEGYDDESGEVVADNQVRLLRAHGLNNPLLPTLGQKKTRTLARLFSLFHEGAMASFVDARKREAREAAHLAHLLLLQNQQQEAMKQQAAQQQAIVRKVSAGSGGDNSGGRKLSALSSWRSGVSVGGMGSFARPSESAGGPAGGVPSSSSSGSQLSTGSSGGPPSSSSSASSAIAASGRVTSNDRAARPPQKVSFGTASAAAVALVASSAASGPAGNSLVAGSVLRNGSLLFAPEAMSGMINARTRSMLPPEGLGAEEDGNENEEGTNETGGGVAETDRADGASAAESNNISSEEPSKQLPGMDAFNNGRV